MTTAVVVSVVFVALLALVVVVVVVPALNRRGGVVDQHSPTRIADHQSSAADAARAQGWQVEEGDAAASRSFPSSLRAEQVEPRTCTQVVTRPDFVAESWDVKVTLAGAAVGGSARQHLVRVPTTSSASVVLRPFPRPGAPMLLPASFKGRMVESGGPRGFLTGGDWTAVAPRLEPLVPEIGRHEWWVVVADGHVTVTSHVEPDASELLARVELALAVAAALA